MIQQCKYGHNCVMPQAAGSSVFPNQASLEQVLKVLFPNHHIHKNNNTEDWIKRGGRELREEVRIFCDCLVQVIKNARRTAHIASASSNYFLELDFWFPDLKMALSFRYLSVLFPFLPL